MTSAPPLPLVSLVGREMALALQGADDGHPQAALRRLADCLRPRGRQAPAERWVAAIEALSSDAALRTEARHCVRASIDGRRAVLLLASAGIYPETSAVAETFRRISRKALPEADEPRQLKSLVDQVFRAGDAAWLRELTLGQWKGMLTQLGAFEPVAAGGVLVPQRLASDLLEALRIVAHRVAAGGLEPEMLRLDPALERHASPFLEQCAEALELVRCAEAGDEAAAHGAVAQLRVLLAQCDQAIDRVRKRARSDGASFHLTFRLLRLRQQVRRLSQLAEVVRETLQAPHDGVPSRIRRVELVAELVTDECAQGQVGSFVRRNVELVALRVTENAGRAGDHYITRGRSDYFRMLRAAAGGGFVVAWMAALKVAISARGLPPLTEVLANCLNYGLGFVLIHLVHFVVATKQPAMTANVIAAAIGEAEHRRRDPARFEPLVDLIARTLRSQLAAIIGNIGLAVPTALLIAWSWSHITGGTLIDAAGAAKVIVDLDAPWWPAVAFAGVAGVCLFLAGLVAGYFDNFCAYQRIPERLQRLRWPRRLVGQRAWVALTRYIEHHLGALAGNFLLGFMLGGASGLGMLLGLPLDVRHVTLTSAFAGFALHAVDFQVPLRLLVSMGVGVALIGMVNLGVSFFAALSVALRARGVTFGESGVLLMLLARRLLRGPRAFLLPPKREPQPAAPQTGADG